MALLNPKLGKGQSFHFGYLNETEFEAMETLQQRLPSQPIWALSRPNGRYTLDIDACNNQVGCFLLQEQPGRAAKPVGYWSHALNQAEYVYDKMHREWLAVVWAVLPLGPYLEGSRFPFRTDDELSDGL